MNKQEAYHNTISDYLGVHQKTIQTYWKGRVALYTALKAMNIGQGDEVILPAFTCVVVPNAIIYLGATPVYVDIDKNSLCASAKNIEDKLSPKTKCILIQNMLGLSFEVDEIITLASSRGIYTLEDCTHGFGGTYNGVFNGLKTDCSFYSTQWNKPFSTGIGGILYVQNKDLLGKIENINKELKTPSFKNVLNLRILLFARTYILKNWSYWFLLRLYRRLSAIGLVVGSSSKEEIEGVQEPNNYFMGLSQVQAHNGIKALKELNKVIEQRKKNGIKINEWMQSQNKCHLSGELICNHSFLKFPALVKNRESFLLAAEKNKIPMGDWFTSPLHPVQDDLSQWKLNVSEFPIAQEVSRQIVNLPTDINHMDSLMRFLEKHKNELL
ncbi:DegT/DnrJ/EryC1/StrS family aminotransferase [Crocinitomicaceae bacterium]|nr:DegT/DnrJ/EryC1/StrS family aminotransferase [Crocinitomicaceae bacterium]